MNWFKTIQLLIAFQIKLAFPMSTCKTSTGPGLCPPLQSQFVPFFPLGTEVGPHRSPNTLSFVQPKGFSVQGCTLGLKCSPQPCRTAPPSHPPSPRVHITISGITSPISGNQYYSPTSLFSIPTSYVFPP